MGVSTKELTARAICHRCGGAKGGPLVPCKACGFVPMGEERMVAWLFSEHHLSSDELSYATTRVRAGHRPDPSQALKALAREAMGAQPLTDAAREPLGLGTVLLLLAGNLLLTPLLGLATWFGLREERPAAARQALLLTLPIAVGLTVIWLAVVISTRFRFG